MQPLDVNDNKIFKVIKSLVVTIHLQSSMQEVSQINMINKATSDVNDN